MSASPTRTLVCCVCGQPTRGRQHWNRDAGYGVCAEHGQQTADREGEAVALSYYGERGIHWDVEGSTFSREQKLTLIFRHTHRDYKSGKGADRAILIFRNGTSLVPLDALTDEEIAKELPYALSKEVERKTKAKTLS